MGRRLALLLVVLLAALCLRLLWIPGSRPPAPAPAGAAPGPQQAPPAAVPAPVPAVPGGELEAGDKAPPAGPRTEEGRQALGATPQGLTLFALEETDHAPVAGAPVFLCRGEELLARGKTGPGGEVGFPADRSAARLLVRAAGRPIHAWEVALTPGRQVLTLPAGEELGGRLRLPDGTAAAGLQLRIRSDHPLHAGVDIPEAVWQAMGLRPRSWRPWIDSAADGSFRFPGLPPGWSGSLVLPYDHRILEATRGVVMAPGSLLRLDAAGRDVDIVVERRPTLFGRLVQEETGQPIAGTALSARIRRQGSGRPDFSSVTTGDDGSFAIRLRFELTAVEHLELRLGRFFHEAWPIHQRDAAGIPADGDLGDLGVAGLRALPFSLHDPGGAPVAGGVVTAGGVSSPPSNGEGRGSLPWLPPGATRARVVAQGFVPAVASIPEVPGTTLVVELAPANRLEVELVLPEGGDPTRFTVRLFGEGVLIRDPGTDSLAEQDHVEEWAMPPPMGGQVHVLSARPKASGLAVFRALEPGQEMTLKVQGVTGRAAYLEERVSPLGPAEVRRLRLDLAGAVRVFRGRVLDLEGRPLVRASLQLGNQILGWTDAEGRFLCFGAGQDPATLLVQHPTCATLFLPDYVLPGDGAPVEFRLSPAWRVVIEVVDEAGTRAPGAEVYILRGGFMTSTHDLGDGRHEATALSSDPVQVQVRLAGRSYVRDLDPTVGTARVVIPLHGKVTLDLLQFQSSRGSGSVIAILRSTGAEGDPPIVEFLPGQLPARWSFDFVPPGTLELQLDYQPSPDEEAAGRGHEHLAGPLPVRVEAGQEVTVNVPRPGG